MTISWDGTVPADDPNASTSGREIGFEVNDDGHVIGAYFTGDRYHQRQRLSLFAQHGAARS